MAKKVSWHHSNKPKLEKLCQDEGYETHWFNEYHVRVITGVCIVDIWTPRMKFNVINIDGSEQKSDYRQLSQRIDIDEVRKLFWTGQLKK